MTPGWIHVYLLSDILLSDTADHALSELQVVPEVLKAIPGLKVVMFGMESDKYTFLRSVQKGVMGYVLKDASTAEVLDVVRAVANDEAVCPSSLQRSLFEFVAGKSDRMPSYYVKQQLGLSRREQQLVQMIGRGLTNKEIAHRLQQSVGKVKKSIHSILEKLQVSDRTQAAVEAVRRGLIR